MLNKSGLYQLLESQKSIWYLEKAYPGTSLNAVAGTLRIKGQVDYCALEKAINIFIRKNDSMRLKIVESNGIAMQYVSEHIDIKLDYFDFSARNGLDDLFVWDQEVTKKPFDIIENELFYFALIKISDDEGGFYAKTHHLISDAWTMGLIGHQVMDHYNNIINGNPILEAPNPSYLDHLLSESDYEKSKRFERDEKYWLSKFDDLPDMTVLKPQKTNDIDISAKRKTLLTPVKLSNKIREFCADNNLSVFTLFMSALSIYINRVTGIEDIVLGTTILNRTNAMDKQTTGMFVSVAAPIRISINDSMNFRTFADAMQKENIKVLRHQKYPYNYLIRELKKKHRFSNRLFDIVLSFQNSKFDLDKIDQNYSARWHFPGYQVESLIISINDREDEGNLVIDYDFRTDVFNIKEIEFIHQHIISLLWHALDNPVKSISKLDMISEKEKYTLLHDFNDTYEDYPRDVTIHHLFEERVKTSPDNIALLFGDSSMTYCQLNERANRLAHTLRSKGVGPDTVVGVMAYRSFELIVGIMAILKAGGAYMPIDSDYPAERKSYMLENSRTDIILTRHAMLDKCVFDGTIIDLDAETSYADICSNLTNINKPNDLAYIIYTSGSTGKPKGVMIEHTGVINSFFWGQKKFDLNQDGIVLQKTAPTFDPSVWEIFWWLLAGGKVCLIESGDEKDPEAIISAIEKYQVKTMHFVPSMLGLFMNYVEETSSAPRMTSLRHLFSCGEAIHINQVEQFNRLFYTSNDTKLYNMYGPTEATVEVACLDCSPSVNLKPVPIGKRIDNFQVYILDRNKNLLPVGIPGEMYISGAGLARGYLNNPELTEESFIDNPFVPGEKMYKTGDRARWYPKGDIEFLGRMDFQVKIKGYRIELGEIESVLLSHKSISETAVISQSDDNGNIYLIAYAVLSGNVNTDAIHSYVSTKLPEYMVPELIILLDKMPLNNNGKIDRSALPKPSNVKMNVNEYVSASNAVEEELADIWRKVLGYNQIGVLDEYSMLGGDSLNAIAIITEIHKRFGLELSPKYIFQLQTIRKLAEHINSTASKKRAFIRIPMAGHMDYYPLSSAQKRQYILNKLDGGISYNLPGGIRIDGNIDKNRVNAIFNSLIKRHESLRTSFEMRDDEPVQIIHQDVDFDVDFIETGDSDPDNLIEPFVRPFDLQSAPLLRVRLASVSEDRHYMLFDMHHIISDGTSINIIIREFTELYNGIEPGKLSIQYKDYSLWHNELLESDRIKHHEVYWIEKFSGDIPVLNMPLDFPRPPIQSFNGDKIHFNINRELTSKIKELASKTDSTLFMVLISVYNVLLSKYSGQEDIIVGTPIEGRNHSDLMGLVGMFVNTLVLRSYPESGKAFDELLNEVREDMLNALEHQEYPFDRLVERIKLKRDISRNPLFNTTFTLRNMDLSSLKLNGIDIFPFVSNNKSSKFDLSFEAVDNGPTIEFSIEYCTDLFTEDTIKRMATHFINALEDIASTPTKKLSEINILSEQERHQLLYEFNDTDADYPRDKTIHQMFEEQAERTPDNIALVFGDRQMTYAQLNERANRLAHTLRDKGVKRDTVVGIIANRSFEMIIAILGILKAGGAYMPIDPDYPTDRTDYMLENSGAEALVLHEGYSERVSFNGNIIAIDEESSYSANCSNPEPINKPSDLAYIIYTSGSTGKPKGVMIEHRSVISLFFNSKFKFDFSQDDTWSLFHSYCFDFTVWEMYGALLRGGRLIIIPAEVVRDLGLFLQVLKDEKVTILCQTPQSIYNLINLELESDNEKLCVRYIFMGGDALKPSMLLPLKKRYPSTSFVNLYGPTEITIFATSKLLEENDFLSGISNIGSVIPAAKAYVMDSHMNVVPIGVPGELYISSNGISRGYVNNEPLTKERFIDDPSIEGSILYRTGDLVRILPSGDIEYLGRTDNQVKVRGYRIELGEIEAQLLTIPEIKEAVVIDRINNSGNKRLYAYFKSDTELKPEYIRVALSKSLPSYMLPAFYVQLEDFPLNTSGKVDKKALPEPETGSERADYEVPQSFIEGRLAEIWRKVLGTNSIGINESFFNIGGDSLNAVAITTLIHKRVDTEISPKDIFQYQTIKELGKYIESLPKTSYEPITAVEKKDWYPVSSAQKRQYILNQIDADGISYNIPCALELEGKTDHSRIEGVFKELISRHESLRTSFELRDGEPVQIIHDGADFKVDYIECDDRDIDEIFYEFIKPFDLGSSPLLRAELVFSSEDRHYLLIDMHHIISDGASLNIFVKEFSELYAGKSLPEPRVQYKDYSAWHNALLKSKKMQSQKDYWLDRFSGEIPVLELPLDFPRPSFQSFRGSVHSFNVNKKLSKELKRLAADNGSTMFMLLFSAYNILLSKYSGQEDIVVGMPIEGRRHADLHDTIGMFVNTLAVRSFPGPDKCFDEFLSEVKEDLLNAYEYQEYPFEELVEKVGVRRDFSRNPLFDTTFALRNTDIKSFNIGKLSASLMENQMRPAKFDLALEAIDTGEVIDLSIEYCADLFTEGTIKRMATHFINALEDIASNPTKKLSEINILSEQERHQLLYEFNDTDADYPRDKTIHQMFEEQVERTPDNIALVFGDRQMTYAQLNERANRLAHTLRDKGVKRDTVVGIIANRSFEMIIAILGIQKSGGAFLPIEPDYPIDRIKYMFENSGISILLIHKEYIGDISFKKGIVILDDEASYSDNISNPDHVNCSSDLAYIIYTSGSTGKPKGVMTEHRNVISLYFNNKFSFDFKQSDTWTFFHSYCFDLAMSEIYGPLLRGGKLIIVPTELSRDLSLFLKLIKSENVTILNQTPQSLYKLIELETIIKSNDLSLKYILIGGDTLKPSLLKSLKNKYPNIVFANLYGPTESTMYITQKILGNEDFNSSVSNIGSAIPSAKIYVFDKSLNIVPIGIPGELYVSGNGLSRGYINNEALTNERFIKNPVIKEGLLYKTGDLVKLLPSGELEFLGRTDNQVKIRGYRIELGEIEARLLAIPEIKEAIVIDRVNSIGDKKLYAYYISDKKLQIDEIKNTLSKNLPSYMLPSFFIQLDGFPLNTSGKIHRKLLPEPSDYRVNERIKPRSKMEAKLTEIWSEVLGISSIGIDDNFFDLGGDSLTAIKAINKADLNISLVDFYKNSTIRLLSENTSAIRSKSDLLVKLTNNSEPSDLNIICFPFGGGNAITFRDMSNTLDKQFNNISLYAVNPPGHDYNGEKDFEELDLTAKRLAMIISDSINGEIVLYAHCAGSALLINTLRHLEKCSSNIKAIFLGAIFPPKNSRTLYNINRLYESFSHTRTIRELIKIGLSKSIISDIDYVNFVTNLYKFDSSCFWQFFLENKEEPSDIPLFCVYGEQDIGTKKHKNRYQEWRKYFNHVHLLTIPDAGHYFTNTHPEELILFISNIAQAEGGLQNVK